MSVKINANILDTTNFFSVSSSTGFNYQYFKNSQAGGTTTTTIIQGGEFGAFMSFNQNNITVSQNGASSSPLTITTPTSSSPLTIKNSNNEKG